VSVEPPEPVKFLRCASFHSVKGGVGKSTLSYLVTRLLGERVKDGERVALVDADLTGTSLADALPLRAPRWRGVAVDDELPLGQVPDEWRPLDAARADLVARASHADGHARVVPMLNDFLLWKKDRYDIDKDVHPEALFWKPLAQDVVRHVRPPRLPSSSRPPSAPRRSSPSSKRRGRTGARRSSMCSAPCPTRRYANAQRLLDVAEGLTVTINEHVADVARRDTGETKISFGSVQIRDVEVPIAFVLELPIFVGGDLFQIPVRLRFNVRTEGDTKRAQWRIEMFGAERTVLACIADMRKTIADKTGLPIFAGTPE
jgi:hypothetical protein